MNLTSEPLRRVRRPTPAEEQARVDAWNMTNAVGCAVTVRRDDGSELETVTQGPAQLLGGHTAVIWGHRGVLRAGAVHGDLTGEKAEN